MSRKARIGVALVLAGAIAGCGETGPKRTVDARTEVLRFYAVDAPAVAVLRSNPQSSFERMDKVAAGLPAWAILRDAVLGPLHAAGLGRARLRRLVRPREEIEGTEAAALAVGGPTPASLDSGGSLLVLATDQTDLLDRLLRGAAADGRLREAGRLDEAMLYRGGGAAFAVRDGVLVSAPSLDAVRAAIKRRDGDRDEQLDDDVVESVFDDLDKQGPLLVYANLDRVREADAGLRALGRLAPWTGLLGQSAATARPVGNEVQIEAVARASGGNLQASDLPIGEAPSRFRISASAAGSLLPPPGPLRDLLGGLAPLTGEATASSDDVRLKATPGD